MTATETPCAADLASTIEGAVKAAAAKDATLTDGERRAVACIRVRGTASTSHGRNDGTTNETLSLSGDWDNKLGQRVLARAKRFALRFIAKHFPGVALFHDKCRGGKMWFLYASGGSFQGTMGVRCGLVWRREINAVAAAAELPGTTFAKGEDMTTSTASDMTVANTTLAQLGGARRVTAMTGARDYVGDANALQFSIKGCRKGNKLRIVLESDDTYTVELWKMAPRSYDFAKVDSMDSVCADSLRLVVERMTGLYLSI